MRLTTNIIMSGLVLLALGAGRPAAQSGIVYQSMPITQTATIVALDKKAREVTIKRETGEVEVVNVDDKMDAFGSLKVGDIVTATFYEALALRVKKPGEPATTTAPMTSVQRRELSPNTRTTVEQTITVTVAAIDTTAPALTVTGEKGKMTFKVTNAALLQGLKAGDAIDLSYTKGKLVKVERPKKK